MKTNILFAFGLAAFFLIGCQGGSPAPSAETSGQPASTSSTGAGTNPTPPSAPAPKPAPTVTLPGDLKTDAYHWYGLSNDKPMKIRISSDDTVPTPGMPAEGMQTVELKSVAGGKAVFDINRDGDLGTNYGSDTVSLEKDGIYALKSAKLTGDIHSLELPSKLPVGATWKNTDKFNADKGATISDDQTFKVVGPQKVTTLAGIEDALLITSTGTLTLNGKKSRMTSSLWYVKDKGLVKNVLQIWDGSNAKGKPRTITFQETK